MTIRRGVLPTARAGASVCAPALVAVSLLHLLGQSLPLARAANPVVPNVGMADPHVHFWDGMFYMYATSDYSANNTGFLMKQWWVA